MYVCMHACIYVFMYVCKCMHACMYGGIYICNMYVGMQVYVCMYACMYVSYVCMHACLRTHTHIVCMVTPKHIRTFIHTFTHSHTHIGTRDAMRRSGGGRRKRPWKSKWQRKAANCPSRGGDRIFFNI